MTHNNIKPALAYYRDSVPVAHLKEYFTGSIKAWGLIQDWRRRITTRFDVDMHGSWQGNTGRLEEEFRFYDGKTQQRVWTITQHNNGMYEGTAKDIIGKAKGQELGSAINWYYVMDIPVGTKIYRFTLDDWMWQMNDNIMINRSYIKKFKITLAELTLFMQKQ